MPFDPVAVTRLAVTASIGLPVVVEDIRHRRISNSFCGSLFGCGLLLGLLQHGASGAGAAVLGSFIGFALFLIPYLLKGMGAGDVKLMAGYGSLIGLSDIVPALVITAVAGALIAAVVLGYRSLTRKPISAIPYAPAIFFGSLLVSIARLR